MRAARRHIVIAFQLPPLNFSTMIAVSANT